MGYRWNCLNEHVFMVCLLFTITQLRKLHLFKRDISTVSFAQMLIIVHATVVFTLSVNDKKVYKLQEGRSVNARLYIAAFSHILETSIIFH